MSSDLIELCDVTPYEKRAHFIAGHAEHFTSAGVRLRVRRAPAPGTQVAFQLMLVTGDALMRGRGVIRWAGTAGGESWIGIEFTALEPESFLVLDEILALRGRAGLSLEAPRPPEGFVHGGKAPKGPYIPPRIAPVQLELSAGL